jgi:plastocyanin
MTRLRTILLGAGTTLVLVLSACGNGPPPGEGTAASGGGNGGGGGGASALQVISGATAPAAKTIQQTDQLKFDPATASVSSGAVIMWTNTGTTPHNVTFDSGPASPTMNGGDKFEVKFTKPGTYHYVCTFHAPAMAGTITVT